MQNTFLMWIVSDKLQKPKKYSALKAEFQFEVNSKDVQKTWYSDFRKKEVKKNPVIYPSALSTIIEINYAHSCILVFIQGHNNVHNLLQ